MPPSYQPPGKTGTPTTPRGVSGTQGLRGARHVLLGSTAERVVQLAECPVLTVHRG